MTHILIAEDEDKARELLTRVFVSKGYEVTAVAHGGEALEALQASSFDLLLSDIVMPQLDGIALARKASKDFPSLRIVLMTGGAVEAHVHNVDALVHEVVSKPFTIAQIYDAVEGALVAPARRRSPGDIGP